MIYFVLFVVVALVVAGMVLELTDNLLLSIICIILIGLLFYNKPILRFIRKESVESCETKIYGYEDVGEVLSQIQVVGIDNVESIIINYKKSRD